MQSDQINELMSALNRAQLAMVPAKKDSENPFFHSRYADLSTVWDALYPFRVEGIVFTQSPQESPDGYIVLDTQMTHAASGQWIRSRLKMRVSKDDPQGYGSAITYARRYALGAMSGLVTEEDDDGNAATQGKTSFDKFTAIASKVDTYQASGPAPKPMLAKPANVAPEPSPAPSAGFIWRVGKHKGESIVTIPASYLEWFAREGKMADHVEQASLELDRRNSQINLVMDEPALVEEGA
jgi:hypothetical protein